jgi:hypothetical protein
MCHHHVGILTVVEAGVRQGAEQFDAEKRDQLMMVASLSV